MKRSIATLLMLTLFVGVMAQNAVKLTPEKFNDYALNYYLPYTTVEIELVASKTTYKAGPYYQYARKYLGTTDVITEDMEVWQLECATIVPRGIADTSNRYQLTFKAGQTPCIYVSEECTILSANIEPLNHMGDTFPAVEADVVNDLDMTAVLSEEILMSGSVARMAEMAAKQIYRIRESRMDILTGEADNMPGDGESMKIVINELDKQEKALTALFTGTKSVRYTAKRLPFTPKDDLKNSVLIRFSPILGFVAHDNLGGAPIYISVNVTERGEYPLDNKGEIKKVPKGAIAYNIPGKAEISLQFNKHIIAERTLNVAQLGVVFGLDPALLTHKKEPSYVIFNPYTGGIEKIGAVNNQ